MRRLLRQSDAPHEFREARVGAEAVQPGIDLEIDQQVRAFPVSVFQPLERRILLSQAGID